MEGQETQRSRYLDISADAPQGLFSWVESEGLVQSPNIQTIQERVGQTFRRYIFLVENQLMDPSVKIKFRI